MLIGANDLLLMDRVAYLFLGPVLQRGVRPESARHVYKVLKYAYMKNHRFTCIIAIAVLMLIPILTHATALPNPIPTNDPESLALQILKIFLGFLALIALIMFILGGFMMLTSAGNADRVKKAKNTLIWAAAGVVVILGSYTFLQFVFSFFT